MEIITVSDHQQKPIELKKSGEYRVEITKPQAEAHIIGTFLTQGDEEIDINLTIVHTAAHTRAHTILKGVAKDNSKIRFFGRIIIEENCGDTQSFLEERILILSDKAKAEAVPELEIKTDDVKCSHAASISRIPEEHIFYLQSRGIARPLAEGLLIEGFLE